MAITAYVLIDTKAGMSPVVKSALLALRNVERADRIQGPHDIVAKIVAPDLWELDDAISHHIRRTEGVVRTTTCLAVSLAES